MIREGTRTSLRPHIYNRNEGSGPWWKTAQWSWHPTIRGYYFGTLFKGWWQIGPSSINRIFELELALGGEDNMLQFGIVLPFIGRWHWGVRVPRKLTRPWIYQRREWTIKVGYIGHLLDVLVAFDDSDMASYYRRKREQGEELSWSRAALWPGWHLTIAPKPRDWLFGRMACETTKGDPEPVLVPLPEGNYPGKMRREERVWKRPRWPWPSMKRTDYWIDMDIAPPVPGKGENSYDCDDDGVYATGGRSPHDAIANVTRAALRDRERYAGPNWTPRDGWPLERAA